MLTAYDFTEELDDDFTFCVLPEPTNEPADPFAGAERCSRCDGSGVSRKNYRSGLVQICGKCRGVGYLGLDTGPTQATPGSLAKIAVMAARYDAGLVLFDERDRGYGNLK